MSICILQLPKDFEERYKAYRIKLGDKHTERKLDVITEVQERAARDLTIVSGQLDVFRNQFSAIDAIQEEVKKHSGVFETIQKEVEAQHKVFEALTRSMSPILDIAREAQKTIEQLGITSYAEQLREPILHLNSSVLGIVDATSIIPAIPPRAIPLPSQSKHPTPAPTTSDDTIFKEQLTELKRIAASLEKIVGRPMPSAIKISLSGKTIAFDEAKPAITVDGKPCPLPPAKNEEYLAKVMFSHPIGEFVDWSIVHKEMTGETNVIGEKSDQKKVRDTMDRLNKRVQGVIGTDDMLLRWENKSLCRNY